MKMISQYEASAQELEHFGDGQQVFIGGTRTQSDDLMLVQEDSIDDETADNQKLITDEEQLTPLAERESDMDELSNTNQSSRMKQQQSRSSQAYKILSKYSNNNVAGGGGGYHKSSQKIPTV